MAERKKKKQEGVGVWIAIAVLFALELWPIALVVLFFKLFGDDDRRRKELPPQAETPVLAGKTAGRTKRAVRSAMKSPVAKKSTAKRLKVIGAVLAVCGLAACWDPIDMMIWLGEIESWYVEELLWARAQVGGAEAKVIGKKLICKGEIHLSAVYRNEASVLTAGFDLPFSQIFDLEEAMDECDLDLTVLITGMHCSLQEGELAVSLEALAQAELWIRRPVTLLADAYCTGCPLDVERAPCTLCVSAQHAERAETARQFCESGIPARQVLMCTAAVECVESKQEEGRLCCTARIRAEVLYLTEDSALCAVGYTLPVQCEIPVPEKTQCRCTCIPRGESTAVPVTGGLEVRCDVLFRWVTVKTERTPCVLSLKPGAVPAAQTPRPSLIVRMVGEGESLWEVAKSCGSTIHDIQAANELDGGPVSQGTLLLIPASRN